MKHIRYFIYSVLFCSVLFAVILLQPSLLVRGAQKETIYNSPYVSFGGDGKAWTTNAGEKDYSWYEKGKRVTTGISSQLRALGTGEHYYKVERTGTLPIGYWEVGYKTGCCIHSNYPEGSWHDIEFGTRTCEGYYYSGWIPYCADCGDEIVHMYHYMSEAAAKSIDYLEVGTDMDYYYLCPHCTNLEMGSCTPAHMCNAISWNRYKVRYIPNANGDKYSGYMEDSLHYYNNAAKYEGQSVTSVNHLTANTYNREGYEFVEWNTEPDGSGISYKDKAEIRNLTAENWQSGQETGVVKLYAQWRPSRSTLQIDPNGGTYQGRQEITAITRDYGKNSIYEVDNTSITAPAGHKVSFVTNGGEPVADITGTRHFTEWSRKQPFKGKFYEECYTFIAPDGSKDTIQANYEYDAIKLPETKKSGSSFGGWYYDAEFQKAAGGPGDTLIPDKDMTLYAQWVDLKLEAKDNYSANSGKGAVDLSWSQSDNKEKSYLLYQSTDEKTWKQIHSAEDIGSKLAVDKSFVYTGKGQNYTIPYTGFYTLTAQGAQGGSTKEYAGGKGGSVSGSFWLQKGEVITSAIGGQNGYNGGGNSSMYANGGGCTVVTSNLKGTLLVAGGGGGAAPSGAGGAGGSAASVLSTGIHGESGGAGGGGGYRGGKAGEYIVHHHSDSCYQDLSGSLIAKYGVNKDEVTEFDHAPAGEDWATAYRTAARIGSKTNLISVAAGASLELEAYCQNTMGVSIDSWIDGLSSLKVYDQNGTVLASQTQNDIIAFVKNAQEERLRTMGYPNYPDDWENKWNWDNNYWGWSYNGWQDDSVPKADRVLKYWWMSLDESGKAVFQREEKDCLPDDLSIDYRLKDTNAAIYNYPESAKLWINPYYGLYRYYFRKNITIPEGTTGIYIEFNVAMAEKWGSNMFLNYLGITKADLKGMKKLICGYTEGEVISSKPAYGGSSYVNTMYSKDYKSEQGMKEGDGSFSIVSKQVGYVETLAMKGVAAPDRQAPVKIALSTVQKEPVGNNQVKVVWQAPEDLGTDYYHRVDSYLNGSEDVLCQSNITKNTLTTGVRGYYYRMDEKSSGSVGAADGIYLSDHEGKGSVTIELSQKVQYLHVAPVDVAGNVGDTTHIRIGSLGGADVRWRLYTRQLGIKETENVYPAGQEKTWYVRSDGTTPFTLYYSAQMDGPAAEDYQINHVIFLSQVKGVLSRNIFTIPSGGIQDGEWQVPTEQVSYVAVDAPLLYRGPVTEIFRKDRNRRLEASQQFILPAEASGREIRLTPSAGADYQGETIYSDAALDAQNSLTLIGDSKPPEIKGLEVLQDRELIDRRKGSVTLHAAAVDDLSGVKEFSIVIYNSDNTVKKTYKPGTDGSIEIVITEDEPVFSGDFAVTARAVDNVGNERLERFDTLEFSLEAEVKRVLEPHYPVFQCGESGILTITTWGYVDRVEVEFPREMTALYPGLNQVYTYTMSPKYRQEEKLEFVIPLQMTQNASYVITVRAYKEGRQLEAYPELGVIEVEGSLLKEIRTRLR